MSADRGRPRGSESDRRRRRFVALVVAGEDFDRAAAEARIKPERALAILSTPELRQIIAAAA